MVFKLGVYWRVGKENFIMINISIFFLIDIFGIWGNVILVFKGLFLIVLKG